MQFPFFRSLGLDFAKNICWVYTVTRKSNFRQWRERFRLFQYWDSEHVVFCVSLGKSDSFVSMQQNTSLLKWYLKMKTPSMQVGPMVSLTCLTRPLWTASYHEIYRVNLSHARDFKHVSFTGLFFCAIQRLDKDVSVSHNYLWFEVIKVDCKRALKCINLCKWLWMYMHDLVGQSLQQSHTQCCRLELLF